MTYIADLERLTLHQAQEIDELQSALGLPTAGPRMVVVEWLDSVLLDDGAWSDVESWTDYLAPEPLAQRSVGLLVKESEEALVLCSSLSLDGKRGQGGFVIARRSVLSIHALTRSEGPEAEAILVSPPVKQAATPTSDDPGRTGAGT